MKNINRLLGEIYWDELNDHLDQLFGENEKISIVDETNPLYRLSPVIDSIVKVEKSDPIFINFSTAKTVNREELLKDFRDNLEKVRMILCRNSCFFNNVDIATAVKSVRGGVQFRQDLVNKVIDFYNFSLLQENNLENFNRMIQLLKNDSAYPTFIPNGFGYDWSEYFNDNEERVLNKEIEAYNIVKKVKD